MVYTPLLMRASGRTGENVMAPALYGGLIGIVFLVFTKLLAQPIGSVIYWGFFTVQLSWFAAICWRRTGLAFVSAAMVTGAISSMCLAVLAAIGHPFPSWSSEAWVLFAGSVAIGLLFLFIESRVSRAKWKQWTDHMERQTLWDIVTARHIPDLRGGG